ncbi:MAG TPA: TOBE domain-containing protein, partial [Bacteroidales bacterium]|nr:TOBE domain-containing protein [Bacteroidales bacterium]
MNKLNGHIQEIDVSGSLSLITIRVGDALQLKSIVIETPETAEWLREGNPVKVLFKETEVVIGTGDNLSISLQNRMKGDITKIERGRLISRVFVGTPAGVIISVISTNAVNQLNLAKGKT